MSFAFTCLFLTISITLSAFNLPSIAMEKDDEAMDVDDESRQSLNEGEPLGLHGSVILPHENTPYLKKYKSRQGVISPFIKFEELLKLAEIHKFTKGQGVRVGVYDAAGNVYHPDVRQCYKDPQPMGINCRDNHGINVSSVIARVAPAVKMTLSDHIKDLNGVHILNVSRGFLVSYKDKSQQDPDEQFKHPYLSPYPVQIKKLLDSKTLVVLSAGNEGKSVNPGLLRFAEEEAYGRMMIVGSLKYEKGEKIASYSNYLESDTHPFICAPGSKLLLAKSEDQHEIQSGTSYAAPVVVGALALLMQAFPYWEKSPEKYVDIILRSARKNPQLSQECGRGILDIEAAIDEARWEVFLERLIPTMSRDGKFNLDIFKGSVTTQNISLLTYFNNPRILLPLMIVRGNKDAVEKIIKANPDILNQKIDDPRFKRISQIYAENNSISPLDLAILSGHGEIVELLLERKALINFDKLKRIFSLAKLRNPGPNTLRLLTHLIEISKNRSSDGLVDSYGRSLLMVAAYHNLPMDVLKTIHSMSDIKEVDNFGFSALDWAIIGDNYDGFKLLSLNQDLWETNKLKFGTQYAQLAAALGKVNILKYIMKDDEGKSESVNELSMTSLHYACQMNQVEAARFLLSLNTDFYMDMDNAYDIDGKWPIHHAAENDASEIIDLILQKNKEHVNKKDLDDGAYPIHYAVRGNAINALVTLFNYRGIPHDDTDYQKRTALHIAVMSSASMAIIDLLFLTQANANAKDVYDKTPLHYALEMGNIPAIQGLKDRKDADGKTPLHLAVQEGDRDALEALIKNDADLNVKDNDGMTPLHLAVTEGNLPALKVLIKYNAKRNITDNRGYIPIEYAKIYRFTEAIDILEEAMRFDFVND